MIRLFAGAAIGIKRILEILQNTKVCSREGVNVVEELRHIVLATVVASRYIQDRIAKGGSFFFSMRADCVIARLEYCGHKQLIFCQTPEIDVPLGSEFIQVAGQGLKPFIPPPRHWWQYHRAKQLGRHAADDWDSRDKALCGRICIVATRALWQRFTVFVLLAQSTHLLMKRSLATKGDKITY